MKICPKCGAENFDFKTFCGDCGNALSESSSDNVVQVEPLVKHAAPDAQHHLTFSQELASSAILGIFIMILPLPITYFSIQLIADLSWAGFVAPGLLYGAYLLLVMELMFLFGSLVFNREYRPSYLETPARGILVFLLTFSIAPFLILFITSVIGSFPFEFAALIFLGILLIVSWLLFFGWLGESRPEKLFPKKTA